MRSVANFISSARILLTFTLALTKPLSATFIIIYIFCGVSDMLDGYIARKTGTTSRLGEKLDSFADFIMITVLIIILYPIVNPTVQILIWVILIGMIRLISVVVVFVKYKTFGMLHTYGNKITGFMLFLFPLVLTVIRSNTLMNILCIAATVSAIEELAIDLLSNDFQANKKSIFIK